MKFAISQGFATSDNTVNATQIHPRAATILPRVTCKLTVSFAWGLKHMLAGLVLVSAMIGLLAVGSAIALSVPTGLALILYPVVCSLSLLTLAAIGSRRSSRSLQPASMVRQQA